MDLSSGSCEFTDPEEELWRPHVYHDATVVECLESENTSESCVNVTLALDRFHYIKFEPKCPEHADLMPFSSYEDLYVSQLSLGSLLGSADSTILHFIGLESLKTQPLFLTTYASSPPSTAWMGTLSRIISL
jgi:hypothetical protein